LLNNEPLATVVAISSPPPTKTATKERIRRYSTAVARAASIEYTILCKLYIFCDKVIDPVSKELVIGAIRTYTK